MRRQGNGTFPEGGEKRVARKFLYVVAALVVLVVVMILGFVKPRGTTPWAARPVS